MHVFGWITRRAAVVAAVACSAFLFVPAGVAFAPAEAGPARCEEPSGETPFWQPFCRFGGPPQRAPEGPPERPGTPAFDDRMAVEGLCKAPKGYTSDLFCRVDETPLTKVPPPPREKVLP